MRGMNNTVWIATVSTRYEIVAVDTDPKQAIKKACEFALKWLREQGVTEFDTTTEVEEYFGVGAYAVTVGTAALVANAEHYG